MYITPGSPAQVILGENAPEEKVKQLEEEMGLNDPFLIQYGRFLKNGVQGDFGRSYQTNRPVFQDVLQRFPGTLKLTFAATFVALIIGIPIGIISATKQYSLMDSISMLLALLGVSMPGFG